MKRALGVALVAAVAWAAPADAAWVAVTANSSSSVSTFDPGTGAANPPLALSGTPQRLAIAPDGRAAYVGVAGPCASGGAVQGIDLSPSPPRLGARIALGTNISPAGLVISPDATTLYAASSCDDSLALIDLTRATPTVGTRLRLGGAATDLAVAPDGNTLYASLRAAGAVAVVDLTRVPPSQAGVRTVPVPSPGPIAITSDGADVYVANTGACTVTPLSADGVVRPAIGLGTGCTAGPSPHGNPADLAMSPDGDRLYASSPDAQRVTGVEIPGGVASAPIDLPGFAATGLAFTPDDVPNNVPGPFVRKRLLVTDSAGDGVQVIEVPQDTLVGGPIAAGATGAFDIAVTPDQPPVSRFTVDPGPPGSATRVDARGSTVATGTIGRYIWNWGDLSSRFGSAEDSHVYREPGLYTIRLITSNMNGASTANTTFSTGGTLLRRGGSEAVTSRTVVVGRSRVRPPLVGRRFVARVTSGRVLVRRRGRFRLLRGTANVPAGAEIETARGVLELTVARNRSGETDTIAVAQGRFVGRQTRGATPVTTLRLSQPLACPRPGRASAAAKRRRKRRIRTVHDTGIFKTKGSYAATSVEGTIWTTTDRCGSTRIDVEEGVVSVRDRVRRVTLTLRGGQSYTARARP